MSTSLKVTRGLQATIIAQRARIEALEEGIRTIRTAAEFHGQAGISSYLMRYAHETAALLCDMLLSDSGTPEE